MTLALALDILKSTTSIVGLIGLWFGLLQYRATRTYKRLEFAASLLDKLATNPDLKLATVFLDWRRRTLLIPDRFKTEQNEETTFTHTHRLMAAAFSLENREEIIETKNLDLKLDHLTLENIIYVEVFDAFFGYLEQVNNFIELKLINLSDVEVIVYWATRILEFSIDGRYVFKDYLKYFGYNGVINLVWLSSRQKR